MPLSQECVNAHRIAAQEFIKNHTQALANDLVAWRNKGMLPSECKFHELAILAKPDAVEGGEYQLAEHLLLSFLLKQAAGDEKDTAAEAL